MLGTDIAPTGVAGAFGAGAVGVAHAARVRKAIGNAILLATHALEMLLLLAISTIYAGVVIAWIVPLVPAFGTACPLLTPLTILPIQKVVGRLIAGEMSVAVETDGVLRCGHRHGCWLL
jgi:hypothetical protein